MKINKILFVVILFIIAIGYYIYIQKATTTPQVTVQYEDITIQEAKSMIDSNEDVLILDVRTEAEFAQGHLAGAINIPHFNIEERYKELNVDKNKSIITICTMGGRSRLAAESLSKLGFTNVHNMVGGLNEWYRIYGESNYG